MPARVAVALALAVACAPAVVGGPPLPTERLVLFLLLIKEVAVGLALGFAMALVFRAAEAAGDLIDASRGQSASEILDPARQEPSSPLGTLFGLLAVALFLLLGGHLLAVAAVSHSFEQVPVNVLPSLEPGRLGMALLAMTAHLLVVAASLAAPALIALLLADLALGLITRTAPQINAYFLALPLKGALGLLAVVASLAFAVRALKLEFGQMLDEVGALF
jgi:flagellar biosynthetic protein FliR